MVVRSLNFTVLHQFSWSLIWLLKNCNSQKLFELNPCNKFQPQELQISMQRSTPTCLYGLTQKNHATHLETIGHIYPSTNTLEVQNPLFISTQPTILEWDPRIYIFFKITCDRFEWQLAKDMLWMPNIALVRTKASISEGLVHESWT